MLISARTLRFGCVFALVSGLLACGSAGGVDDSGGDASTGVGGTGSSAGGTSANGGTTGAGANGPATNPSPGAPPTNAAGAFTFSHLQAGTSAAKNSANALFFQMTQTLSDSQYQYLFNDYSEVPIDSCTSLPVTSNSANGMSSSSDAGMVSVKGPDGTSYPVAKMKFAGLSFYEGDLPDTAFTPDAHYILETTGATVGAFQGDFYTPGDLTVTAPVATGPLTVTSGQPIELAWTGTPDGSNVIVQLTQLGSTITCRLTDDGAFTVPASAFEGFQSTTSSDRPEGSPMYDSIYVVRTNWYSVGDSSAATLMISQVGAKYDADFE